MSYPTPQSKLLEAIIWLAIIGSIIALILLTIVWAKG